MVLSDKAGASKLKYAEYAGKAKTLQYLEAFLYMKSDL